MKFRTITGLKYAQKNSVLPDPGNAPNYVAPSIFELNPDLQVKILDIATTNLVEARKQRNRAWIPVIIGLAITATSELVSHYFSVPGFGQIACGALGLVPTAAGVVISRFQVREANELIRRSLTGIKKSGKYVNINPGNLYSN